MPLAPLDKLKQLGACILRGDSQLEMRRDCSLQMGCGLARSPPYLAVTP